MEYESGHDRVRPSDKASAKENELRSPVGTAEIRQQLGRFRLHARRHSRGPQQLQLVLPHKNERRQSARRADRSRQYLRGASNERVQEE